MTDPLAAPPGGREAVPAAERAAVAPADPPAFMFVVPGQPLGWARAGGGKTMHRFTPAPQRSYAGTLKLFCQTAMKGAPPFDGPIKLTIEAAYPWPASWSMRRRDALGRWKVSRPDIDNIAKIVMDSLNTIAWTDDARICSVHLMKYYDDIPQLRVCVREIE